jgi:hypothetical protein
MDRALVQAVSPAEAGWVAPRPVNSALSSARGDLMPAFGCGVGRFIDALRSVGGAPQAPLGFTWRIGLRTEESAADFGYPRPQLVRPDWTSLNGIWRFAYDDKGRYIKPEDIAAWPMTIRVPFPPESAASGIGDRGFQSVCWYQRDFDLIPGDARVLLYFGAVDYAARILLNNCLVVVHEGGHTPFVVDISDILEPSGRQTRAAKRRP